MYKSHFLLINIRNHNCQGGFSVDNLQYYYIFATQKNVSKKCSKTRSLNFFSPKPMRHLSTVSTVQYNTEQYSKVNK